MRSWYKLNYPLVAYGGAYGTNQSDGSDRTNRQRFRSLSHFSDLGRPIGAYWSLWVANRRFADFPTHKHALQCRKRRCRLEPALDMFARPTPRRDPEHER
jgi:hypothetical protein